MCICIYTYIHTHIHNEPGNLGRDPRRLLSWGAGGWGCAAAVGGEALEVLARRARRARAPAGPEVLPVPAPARRVLSPTGT